MDQWKWLTITMYDDLNKVRKRDKMKQILCSTHGITLIVIPYWWNRTLESVAQMIRLSRPDIKIPLHYLKGNPIPNEVPKQLTSKGTIFQITEC